MKTESTEAVPVVNGLHINLGQPADGLTEKKHILPTLSFKKLSLSLITYILSNLPHHMAQSLMTKLH